MLLSRTGLLLVVSAALGALSAAGSPGARVTGPIAIAFALAALIDRLSHQHGLNARHHREVAELKDHHREMADLMTRLQRSELAARHAAEQATKQATEKVDRLSRDLITRTWSNTELAREGLRLVRQELTDLSLRIRPDAPTYDKISAEVENPLVSIAIPGFNRPEQLEKCLQSIVDEVERVGTDRVEVWITDDQSTLDSAVEVSRSFAERYSYIGFQANEENVGLERNLLEACLPCNGQYVWILGNDDQINPGALNVVLEDLATGAFDLFVYSKIRIDSRGEVMDNVARGSVPDDATPNERRTYDDILGFARSTGVLSGYGFISVVLVRRELFVAVDSSPYLGLTMYPQVGRLLESVGSSAMQFANVPIVKQRTTARAEKLAEAVGRPEEGFMAGGLERDIAWFGSTLAALLMRVCDRSDLQSSDFADVPELLFGRESLVGWIAANVAAAEERGLEQSDEIEADAARFLSALQ